MLRGGRAGVLVLAALVVLGLLLAAVVDDGDEATPTAAVERSAAREGTAGGGAATPVTVARASSTETDVSREAAEDRSSTSATEGGGADDVAARAAAASTSSDDSEGESSDLPLAGRTIVVDPGHNGANATHPSVVNRTVRIGNGSKACDTTGTESVLGQSEHAYTWSVARQVRLALEAAGATVVLTRPDDRGVGPCITKRMPRANAAKADLAVSIHGDGGPAGGRGFHVILPGKVPSIARHDRIVAPSARLGRAVRAAFRSGTGMPYSTYLGSRGLDVRTDLGGLNLIRVPGVMVETGNMRNATDARLMADPSWRRRAGKAIAAGITTWLTAGAR